ncbi:heterokaryon incompatibility protein-domain-containing protein [Lasiosphaeris hirsuta]|uniref:Heterokaryon incompatibility protein-domain-containing protein n=1 Tax=Lasiosphaeris hirsuta TaxID=260670 RepID=A0AA40BDD6_9PEZI|nr:heterokaryon incompatibility protein-domain-containing protein [Lasiosphaeris hirsuta]
MSSPLYIQVPLTDPTSEIRLLTVERASHPDEAIVCRLSVVALASPGYYEGLSYHWSGSDKTILVNDLQIPVTGNLFNALAALRYADRPRVLWVDAVCIDQQSNGPDGEKSEQIKLMRHIYQQSQRTVAWFGQPAIGDGGTRILDGFVKRLLRIQQQLETDGEWPAPAEGASFATVYLPSQAEIHRRHIPHNKDIGYQTLAHLVTRSWTERVWTIQEAAVARETLIQCGPYIFRMQDIAMAASFVWAMNIEDFSVSTHFKSTWAECAKQKRGQRGTLLSLVIRHWLSDAKYPRDKIYALCGLSRDAGPDGLDIQFDDTASPEQAYTDFARSVLRTYRNLDILSALAPVKAPRSPNMPSWAPDWRRETFNSGTIVYRRPDPLPEPGPCRILFTAAGGSPASPLFSSDGRSLGLEGFILDTIVEGGAVRPFTFEGREMVGLLMDWRDTVARCLRKRRYGPTGQPMTEAFYHTMTMGNVRHFLQDPLEEYKRFDSELLGLAVRWGVISGRMHWLLGFKMRPRPEASWPNLLESSVVFSASGISTNRRLARTKTGYLCLVPQESKIGDHIALFKGGPLPLVIRKSGSNWVVIGDAYVHGIMMGEAYDAGIKILADYIVFCHEPDFDVLAALANNPPRSKLVKSLLGYTWRHATEEQLVRQDRARRQQQKTFDNGLDVACLVDVLPKLTELQDLRMSNTPTDPVSAPRLRAANKTTWNSESVRIRGTGKH